MNSTLEHVKYTEEGTQGGFSKELIGEQKGGERERIDREGESENIL